MRKDKQFGTGNLKSLEMLNSGSSFVNFFREQDKRINQCASGHLDEKVIGRYGETLNCYCLHCRTYYER